MIQHIDTNKQPVQIRDQWVFSRIERSPLSCAGLISRTCQTLNQTVIRIVLSLCTPVNRQERERKEREKLEAEERQRQAAQAELEVTAFLLKPSSKGPVQRSRAQAAWRARVYVNARALRHVSLRFARISMPYVCRWRTLRSLGSATLSYCVFGLLPLPR